MAGRVGRGRGTVVAALLAALAGAWFVLGPVQSALTVRTYGFPTYYTSSRLALEGRWSTEVYDNAWYSRESVALTGTGEIYRPSTPVMALMALPLAGLPYESARVAWLADQIVLLAATLAILAAALPLFRRPAALLGLGALVLAFGPVHDDVRIGQGYIGIGWLGALALLGVARGSALTTGLAVGAAVATKLAAIPVGLVLAARADGRTLGVAAATATLLALLTLPFAGLEGWLGFVQALAAEVAADHPVYATPAIQSTTGMLTHFLVADSGRNPWAVVDAPAVARVAALAAGAVVLGVTLLAARRGPAVVAVGAAIVAGLLTLPLAQEYHGAVLLAPVAVALAWLNDHREHGRRRLIVRTAWLGLAIVLAGAPLPFRETPPPGGPLDLLWYPRLAGSWLLWAWLVLAALDAGEAPVAQRAAPVTR